VNKVFTYVCETKGNKYKLQLTHIHYNLCKHFFSNLIVAAWNSLPNIIALQSLIIYLKIMGINSGLSKNLNLIFVPTLPELEAVVC